MIAILLFACITVFLLFKFKDLLGQNIGNMDPLNLAREKVNKKYFGDETVRDVVNTVYSESYLNDIVAVFPDFELQDFQKKAKLAFSFIFNAYARGEISEIRSLVTNDVYKAFGNAIESRAQASEQLIVSLNRVVFAEVVDGCVAPGDEAHLSVRFTIEQNSSVMKDGCESHSSIVETCVHVWEFCRKRGSQTWLLCNLISTE